MRNPKIPTVARYTAVFIVICMIALSLVGLYALYKAITDPASLAEAYPNVTVVGSLSTASIAAIIFMGVFNFLVTIYVLNRLRLLMVGYAKEDIFSFSAVSHIHAIGAGLIVLAIGSILTTSIDVLALTASNPQGQRSLVIGIQNGDIGFLLSGVVVILIGWIMREAVSISYENKEFV